MFARVLSVRLERLVCLLRFLETEYVLIAEMMTSVGRNPISCGNVALREMARYFLQQNLDIQGISQ